jgi:hypothetical protein
VIDLCVANSQFAVVNALRIDASRGPRRVIQPPTVRLPPMRPETRPRAARVRARLRRALWSAKMMRVAVSRSCGLADQLIFMMQPVQHPRRDHTTARGEAMAGGLRPDQRR